MNIFVLSFLLLFVAECADIPGTDWWGDIKWMTSELWIGAPNNWASVAAMWSLAAEPNGVRTLLHPFLPHPLIGWWAGCLISFF